ncbi:uncharacterized protein LOC34622942 [Cyclospora cayetanensis]|uniref:Uncharacterized protein LOC34622942 n=1 Tax=Cyclospora cayetanensis TaxID=88456 RepID=A0A6P6RYK6_9EIME|nr:uncharacterized protein LOC34622942 [Cyclospora cayetanensis]
MLENAKLPLILALLAVSCIIYPTSSQLPPLPTGENEFQEEPGEVETSAPEHVPLKEAIHPGQASVSVIPSTHRVVALPPANVPPEGVMFENKAPSNIQTFQVPGVGLPIEESQQVPFIFINNVASETPKAASLPGVAEAVPTSAPSN